MAVATYGTVSKGENTSTTSLSFSHTVGAGDDRCLFVAVTSYTSKPSGVTFDGNSMTEIITQVEIDSHTTLYRYLAPGVTTANVIVTFASAMMVTAHAVNLSGVDQTTPVEDSDSSSDTTGPSETSTATPALTGSTNGLVLDCLTIWDRVGTEGSGQTAVFSESNTTVSYSSYGSEEAGGASVTMSYTWSGAQYYAHAAAAFKAAVAADRQAQVSWAAFEVPDYVKKAQVSWFEFEVPDYVRGAQVSWFELETPAYVRKGVVSWFAFETPGSPAKGQVSWFEFEVADFDKKGQVSWFEFEVPNLFTNRRNMGKHRRYHPLR